MNQNFVLAQDGGVYSDYESVLLSLNWCTPKFMGFDFCVNAAAAGGIVTLVFTVHTPVGSFSKTFNINKGICFTWNLPGPLSPSVQVCIKNFSTSPRVSFTLDLNFCVKAFGIKKCVSWSHPFHFFAADNMALSAENVKTEDLAALCLLLVDSATENAGECNCH